MSTRILVACLFKNNDQLIDFFSRFIHHFQFHKNINLVFLRESTNIKLDSTLKPPKSLCPPNIFQIVKDSGFKILPRTIGKGVNETINSLGSFNACIIYDEEFYRKHHQSLKRVAKKFYWCDPYRTRQEGSNFIQAALDILPAKQKKANEDESHVKFSNFRNTISALNFTKATIFATGPSVEQFGEYEYSGSLNIYCNSTILNYQLIEAAPPSILTFADPIFHFGVSDYAHAFRVSCKDFLEKNKNVFIIVPIKYYSLLLSLFSSFKERIIGIPFTKNKPINFEISQTNFYTYTTSNILTLCLLPLATTFCKNIRLIGCDGREISDDSYFWNHGTSVQINDKMEIIRKAHPGFFNIDYNEYYYEHCHNLMRMIVLAESHGWTFVHLGPSFIPALKDRQYRELMNNITPAESNEHAFVLLEPDGLSENDGHYYQWHRSLQNALSQRGLNSFVIANIHSSIYNAETDLLLLRNHSWEVDSLNRPDIKQKCKDSKQFNDFVADLKASILQIQSTNPNIGELTLYMYYGSAMHLKAMVEIKKYFAKRIDVNITCCLSYEAIRFTTSRKSFWGDNNGIFRAILLEAQYYFPSVKTYAMTSRFADFIFKGYDILLPTLNHPIFSNYESPICLTQIGLNEASSKPHLLAPCRWAYGKSPDNYLEIIGNILTHSNLRISLRDYSPKSEDIRGLASAHPGRLTVLADKCNDDEYNSWYSSADIVMIPYLPDVFAMRTSGILTDAVMHQKPVVCFGISSISDLVVKHRLGFYCNDMSSTSILNAINRIYAHYHSLLASIHRYKLLLVRENTFSRQIDSILSGNAGIV